MGGSPQSLLTIDHRASCRHVGVLLVRQVTLVVDFKLYLYPYGLILLPGDVCEVKFNYVSLNEIHGDIRRGRTGISPYWGGKSPHPTVVINVVTIATLARQMAVPCCLGHQFLPKF